jgi:hypothetical protein
MQYGQIEFILEEKKTLFRLKSANVSRIKFIRENSSRGVISLNLRADVLYPQISTLNTHTYLILMLQCWPQKEFLDIFREIPSMIGMERRQEKSKPVI